MQKKYVLFPQKPLQYFPKSTYIYVRNVRPSHLLCYAYKIITLGDIDAVKQWRQNRYFMPEIYAE